jgi:hypothetical protein
MDSSGVRQRRIFNTASGMLTVLFGFTAAVALVYGYQVKGEYYLAPDRGPGYALGICGGVMMLLLLLYPLRKHMTLMRNWGAIRHWFRVHMMLGIVGPLCILFHCNFSLGAVNSNIALLCMSVMVSSGLVGRFIYSRIHYGLYGHKATLNELHSDSLSTISLIKNERRGSSETVSAVLDELERLRKYTQGDLGIAGNCWRLLSISPKSRLLKAKFHRRLSAEELPADFQRHVDNYIECIRRMASFSFFDRMFSLWHAFHMPVFFMLVITGTVHVWAVHNY